MLDEPYLDENAGLIGRVLASLAPGRPESPATA
jgi:hypothetical protein